MKRAISVLLCIVLVFSLLFTLNGCNTKNEPLEEPGTKKDNHLFQTSSKGTKDLMENINAENIVLSNDFSKGNEAFNSFAVKMLQKNQKEGKNTLLSPLSILCALSMTANGAGDDTLREFEAIFGMSADEMNKYLASYIKQLPDDEKYSLKLANSIWFTNSDEFKVNQDFLQKNADYYKPQIYSADFNGNTVKDINNWVKKNTDGMIPKVIDELDENTLMCLINALAFDAEWETVYEENQVRDSYFYAFNGDSQKVEYMFNNEHTYLCDEESTGFIKYYADRKYAFVAVLPNKDITLSQYISSLTGDKIANLLNTAQQVNDLRTKLPKFEYAFNTELSEILKNMGMKTAFDSTNADFSGVGAYSKGNIFLSKVIHKTYISVAEKGTRAGAVTAEILCGSSAPQKVYEVYLDRPFMYMIIDCENNLPFFIGTVTTLEG